MWNDFKQFAFKGNVVDLAVGVIIGGAFGKIVSGVVGNVVMPVVSLLMPSGDWKTAALTLKEGGAPGPEGDTRLLYGELMNTVVEFFIVAFVLFVAVRAIGKATKKQEAAPAAPTTKECPKCFEQVAIKATRCKFCTSEL